MVIKREHNRQVKKINLFSIVFSLFLAVMVTMVNATEGKIKINTATKEELMTLKYVGEALAERNLEYRQGHPFEVPEDIMKVKGIR